MSENEKAMKDSRPAGATRRNARSTRDTQRTESRPLSLEQLDAIAGGAGGAKETFHMTKPHCNVGTIGQASTPSLASR